MAISSDVLEKICTEEDVPELDLSWLKPDDARPGTSSQRCPS